MFLKVRNGRIWLKKNRGFYTRKYDGTQIRPP